MQFDYGNVLSRAWQVIWRFKVLWIFGILASCGRGGGGGASFNFSGGGGNSGDFEFEGPPPESFRFFQDVPPENFWITVALIGIALIALILILSVFLFMVRTMGRLGLIQGTLFAEAGAERLGFMQLFNASRPYFLRALLLNLLIGVAALVIGGILSAPIILMTVFTFGLALLCLIPILFILGWFVQVFVEQSNVALVVDDLDAIAALQRGWQVVRSNWGPPLVMGLVLYVIRLAIGFVIAIPVILAFGPLIAGGLGGIFGESIDLFFGGFAVTLLCLCTLLPFLLAVGGAVESYVESAWTLTYIQLTGHGPSLPELEAGMA